MKYLSRANQRRLILYILWLKRCERLRFSPHTIQFQATLAAGLLLPFLFLLK